MKNVGLVASLLIMLAGTFLFAEKRKFRDDARDQNQPAADIDRSVVTVRGTKPFVVREDEIVRLTGEGIAGSTATIDVIGKAKVIRNAGIREVVNGATVIGPGNTEFELQPVAKGTVIAVVTVTFPTNVDPKVTTYKFEVE